MNWNNRVTELFECQYPILQGAMVGFADWEFAAACCEAGIHGCLTASNSKTKEGLREDIKRVQGATDKAFTVNLSIGNCPDVDGMLDVLLESDVKHIETAVFNADAQGKRIKEAGKIWIHKAATTKHCAHAVEKGADAVIIVGLEGVGYKNIDQTTTLFSGIDAAKTLGDQVPVIIAGGIGDGRSMIAGLGTGCDGIMMGTRLMATKECKKCPDKFKQDMIQLKATTPSIRFSCLQMPDMKAYEEVMAQRKTMPLEEWMPRLERVMLKQSDWQEAVKMWDTPINKIATQFKSMAVEFIDEVQTIQEVVDGMVKEAEEIVARQFGNMFK